MINSKVDSMAALQQISQLFLALGRAEYVWIGMRKKSTFQYQTSPGSCASYVNNMSEILQRVMWTTDESDVTYVPISEDNFKAVNCDNIGFAAYFNGTASAAFFTDEIAVTTSLKVLCGNASDGKSVLSDFTCKTTISTTTTVEQNRIKSMIKVSYHVHDIKYHSQLLCI